MSDSVLDQLTLGYRLLWNRRREIAAVELHADPLPETGGIDARHLLATLAELWPTRAPQLLLRVGHPLLLLDLLAHGRADGPWLVLPPEVQTDAVLRPRAQQAQARGLPLLWPGRLPAPATPTTQRPSVYLTDTAQAALFPGQIVLGSGHRTQTDAALDQHAAWALAGWPVEDVLHSLPAQARQPDRTAISRVVRAIDDDADLDRIETLLCADPVLAYRFLQHVNTTAPQLRGEIDTLQRGLQVWGLQHVQAWLLAQLPQAASEPALLPVRLGMVIRARLLEHLLDAGDEEDLRREVHLCGLFSQLDRLLGEPLATALQRLPLSQRILQALLEHSGPYHPALQLARALELADTRTTRLLTESYGYAPEDVNRALLRTLGALPA
ncbi:HDOD domain-containing protein [Methyloversatilis sp.]|uniref:HDOD domain-containing protein n=1 Tax=Methyloversatilis sp. TaxID=2569862 RepID=UPI002732A001|nr:HDOD domain-containing protein [Methyloversatilis sp.]MDP3577779.1 HDOD domain-containing protein [Methyloversatilis sp.]